MDFKLARKSGLPSNWNKYKIVRNSCNHKLRKTKDEYLKQIYKKLDDDRNISNMYKITRSQLGWEKSSTPDSFLVNGTRISSPSLMANIQLKTFNNKVMNLVLNLPVTDRDPLRLQKLALQKWGIKASQSPKFQLSKISIAQTADLLKKIGNSTSCGNDQLDSM